MIIQMIASAPAPTEIVQNPTPYPGWDAPLLTSMSEITPRRPNTTPRLISESSEKSTPNLGTNNRSPTVR